MLIASGTFEWHSRPGLEPEFFTFDGQRIIPPDDALFVHMNPTWLFPEEVLVKPRDERFAHAVNSPNIWNLDAWWYDTGNFGSIGLVVRTIAHVWNIGIPDIISAMEPLHLQDDRDLRPQLETADGSSIRVTAIRLRNPLAGSICR
jgi:hypothetical protein